MATNRVQTGLRLNEVTYEKAKVLSMKEQRSLNNFFEYVIQKYIEAYEDEHGPIPVPIEDQ